MRESKLKELLRNELNAISESEFTQEKINEVTSLIWEKSGRNIPLCKSVIEGLSDRIGKTRKFKIKSLTFLELLEGQGREKPKTKKRQAAKSFNENVQFETEDKAETTSSTFTNTDSFDTQFPFYEAGISSFKLLIRNTVFSYIGLCVVSLMFDFGRDGFFLTWLGWILFAGIVSSLVPNSFKCLMSLMMTVPTLPIYFSKTEDKRPRAVFDAAIFASVVVNTGVLIWCYQMLQSATDWGLPRFEPLGFRFPYL